MAWDEREYLRDDMLILADEIAEVQLLDRICEALNSAALRRAEELLTRLIELRDNNEDLPPDLYRTLLAEIDRAKEVLDMK